MSVCMKILLVFISVIIVTIKNKKIYMPLCSYDCIVSRHLHVPVFLVYFDKHKSKIVNNYYGMYLPASSF